MIRRILAIVLIVLGLATAGVGAAFGTIWRADDTVTATVPQDPEAPVVVAGGNVLATVNSQVTVTVTGQDPETDLVVAMGREDDVRAWLDDASYLEITGLSDWETLAVQTPDESADRPSEEPSTNDDDDASDDAAEEPSEGGEDAVPNPAGSDLWIEQVTGQGELSYDWNQVEGRWMMLVASDGEHPAPTVSMTWTRNVATPLVLPLIIAGAVVFLIGLVWLIIELLVLREERRARAAVEVEGDDVPAVATTDAEGNPLTRRQIREAARAAAAGGGSTRTGNTASGQSPAESDTQQQDLWEADPAASSHEREASGDEKASGAQDLAAWVSSTAGEPEDSTALDRTDPTWQEAEEPAHEPETDEAAPATGLRQRWRRRRRSSRPTPGPRQDDANAPVTEQLQLGTPAGSPHKDADRPETHDEEADSNPQASGASWRATWGLRSVTDQDQDRSQDKSHDQEEDR